jgi:hypothetical protein
MLLPPPPHPPSNNPNAPRSSAAIDVFVISCPEL